MTDTSFDPTTNYPADVPLFAEPRLPERAADPAGVAATDATPPATPATPRRESVLERIDRTLDELEQLRALLAVDDSYVVPPRNYELPPDFKLSVVIPVYNEEPTIREILARVLAQPVPKEVVIVDDHSIDCTRDVLGQLEPLPELRIIYKDRNEGKGAALRTGFRFARGDVIVIQDADLEYDPRDIPRLIRPIVEGDADVVYGSRFLQGGCARSSRVHRLGNRMLTTASNLATGLKLTDMETCYKAFRRDVIRDLDLKQNRFGFEPEFTAKIARRRCSVKELPISYEARGWDDGKKIGVRDAMKAFYCIARYAAGD